MTQSSPKEKSADRFLQITTESRDSYFHVYARVIEQRAETSGVVPYGCDDTYSDGPLYSGLRISCQGDTQSRTGADGREPVYGLSCEYHDVYSVDLRKARRMIKTLEKIDRGLNKISEARGYVRTYPDYVGRLAEILGCKGLCLQRTEKSAAMSGHLWQWETVGDGVNKIANLIYQWQESGKPVAETVTR